MEVAWLLTGGRRLHGLPSPQGSVASTQTMPGSSRPLQAHTCMQHSMTADVVLLRTIRFPRQHMSYASDGNWPPVSFAHARRPTKLPQLRQSVWPWVNAGPLQVVFVKRGGIPGLNMPQMAAVPSIDSWTHHCALTRPQFTHRAGTAAVSPSRTHRSFHSRCQRCCPSLGNLQSGRDRNGQQATLHLNQRA